MRLKKYVEFIKESLFTGIAPLLQSIDAKEVDFFYTLGLDKDKFLNKDIEEIYNDGDFNRQLYDKKLKKEELISTFDTESFLKKEYDMKCFLLIERNMTKIDNPKYLVLQYFKNNQWSNVFMYEVNSNIRNFFEKLTSKTIEITDGDKKIIYQTSNSGNNWVLQNIEDKSDIYKETIDSDELKEILRDKKYKVIE